MDIADQIVAALAIAGPEDFSADGQEGVLEATGVFAQAIIDSLGFSAQHAVRFKGHPVRVSRMGMLELWCDGWYMEGRGIRRVVHQASRLAAMHST